MNIGDWVEWVHRYEGGHIYKVGKVIGMHILGPRDDIVVIVAEDCLVGREWKLRQDEDDVRVIPNPCAYCGGRVMNWRVERHSGRGSMTHGWRVIYDGPELSSAIDVYNKTLIRMRQGGVRFIDPSGTVRHEAVAPRCRTRW
jgi:hypothetical protein